jgi:Raf kinase inhibitor-like YbhB/YbcL family protein
MPTETRLRKETNTSTMRLTSPNLRHGQRIPTDHAQDGTNLSPELKWSGIPEGTLTLAVICEDPDVAAQVPYVHWLLANVDRGTGLPRGSKEIKGATHGMNGLRRLGYDGPAPPVGGGEHRYYFRLYALDSRLPLRDAFTREDFVAALEGHILGMAELMGTYSR